MTEFDYRIVRSPKRKKLTITVERDRSVVVHAPNDASDEQVSRILETKRQWIRRKIRHPQKYQDRLHPPGKEVVNGESAPYLGKDYRIEVTKTAGCEVEFEGRFLVPPAHQANRHKVLREWYIAEAKEKIVARADQLARELGVKFCAVRIVDNRYRWGSCTGKNNVTFNWRLIKAPMFVIDYLIVHELVHLMEPNHTPRFWSIVRAHNPTMEKARRWLKEHGQVLEEEL
jgi:predicted metal-dependent hydrolase